MGEQQTALFSIEPSKPSKPSSSGLVATRVQLAEVLGVTPDHVTRLVSQGMPVLKEGTGRGNHTLFDLMQAIPWFLRRRGGTLEEARTRLANAQAEKVELDLAAAVGTLVRADETARLYRDQCIQVRNRLLAIPAKVKSQHPDLTLQHIATVDDEIRNALEEIAKEPAGHATDGGARHLSETRERKSA